jgi:hypothetical protein
VDIEQLAALIAVVSAAVGGLSGLAGHWLARRTASGKVDTSEAAVLWEQSQDMRHITLEQLKSAEEQRDRLIAAYTEQVLPLLTSVSQLVRDQSLSLTEALTLLRHLANGQGEGGGRELEVPEPQA